MIGLRAAFWLLLAAVAVLSLLPGPQLPAIAFSIWDKAQHALAFAALAMLGLWAYGAAGGQARLMLGLLAFGIGIELAQAATGWRHGEWPDVLADAAGLALGWAAVRVWVWTGTGRGP